MTKTIAKNKLSELREQLYNNRASVNSIQNYMNTLNVHDDEYAEMQNNIREINIDTENIIKQIHDLFN